eukprot:1915462-Karenia_brevis.AAC.1
MKVVGCMISSNGGLSQELDDKSSRVTTAFCESADQLCCRNVGIQMKLGLLLKLVGQILFYGVETTPVTTTYLHRFD